MFSNDFALASRVTSHTYEHAYVTILARDLGVQALFLRYLGGGMLELLKESLIVL